MFKLNVFVIVFLLPVLTLFGQTAQFTMDVDEGCGSLMVHFTNASTGTGNLQYFWQFGNAAESMDQDPFITYTSSGVYTVTLEVTDDNGTSTYTDQVIVHPFPSVAFSGINISGCAPVTTNFTDATVPGDASLVSWEWNFGDGTTSTEQNPSHTYDNPESYSITLEVEDALGCENHIVYEDYVNVSEPPMVSFTAQPPVYCEPTNVSFTNNSVGYDPPLTYSWNFGGGGTSTQTNPTHFFQAGIHTVTLLVTDASGCSNSSQGQVSITDLNPQIEVSSPTICAGESVTFQNIEGTASMWNYGDGSANGYGIIISHIFEDPGSYIVELTAGSGSCASSVTQTINVHPAPEISFDINPDVFCGPSGLTLNNTTIGAVDYEWTLHYQSYHDTSIIFSSSDVNMTYFIGLEGKYYITLEAITSLGCVSEKIDSIDVVFTSIEGIVVSPEVHCIPFDALLTPLITTVDNIISYSWYIDGVLFSNQEIPPAQNYSEVGIFNNLLVIVTEHGCIDSSDVDIYAGEPPLVSFYTLEDTVCIGDTVHIINTSLDSNIIGSYVWFWDSGEHMYVNNNTIIAPDTIGFISLGVAAGYNGCASQYVESPSFYIQGPFLSNLVDSFICSNPFERFLSIEAFDYDTLYWNYGDFSPIDTAGAEVQHIYPNEDIYSVNITAHSETTGCPDYHYNEWIEVSGIEVNAWVPEISCPDLTILLFPDTLIDSLFIMFGDLSSSNSGWFPDTLYFMTHEYTSGGLKELTVIGLGEGCRDTLLMQFTVAYATASYTVDNYTICLGDSITINNLATSNFPIVQYDWFFDTSDTITAFSDTSFQYLFLQGGEHIVQMQVTDSLGCEYLSDPRTIDVHAIDALVSLEDITLCLGDELIVEIDGDITNISILCNYDDFSPLTSSLNHTYTDTGVYVVEVQLIDDAACQEVFTIEDVSVQKAYLDIVLFDDSLYCYPESPVFINSDTIQSYEWSDNMSNVAFVPNPVFIYPERGVYSISVTAETENGCAHDTLFILVIDGPYADINISDDIVCKNDTVQFWMSNDTNIVSYEWTLGDGYGISNTPNFEHSYLFVPENGMFEIVLTYPAEGCDADGDGQDDKYTQIEYINIYPVVADFTLINYLTGLPDTNSCTPLPLQFVNQSQGNGNTYLWELGSINSSTNFQPANYDFVNEVSLSDTVLITMYLKSQEGCKDTAYQEVVIRSVPEIDISEKKFICLGSEVELAAIGGDSIIWTSDFEITEKNNYNITVAPEKSTMIYAKVIEANACENIDSVFVEVQQIPELYSNYSDTIVVVGQEFELNILSDQEGVSYNWSPSEGLSCTDCANPNIKATGPIDYVITIQDSANCHTVQKSIFIDVFYDYTIDVPNTFTPNNDGENDIVYVKGWGLKDLIEFRIYNRWGEEVFFSNDLKVGWDGTKNGKAQNMDTYAYFARVKTFNNIEMTKKGTITLLR